MSTNRQNQIDWYQKMIDQLKQLDKSLQNTPLKGKQIIEIREFTNQINTLLDTFEKAKSINLSSNDLKNKQESDKVQFEELNKKIIGILFPDKFKRKPLAISERRAEVVLPLPPHFRKPVKPLIFATTLATSKPSLPPKFQTITELDLVLSALQKDIQEFRSKNPKDKRKKRDIIENEPDLTDFQIELLERVTDYIRNKDSADNPHILLATLTAVNRIAQEQNESLYSSYKRTGKEKFLSIAKKQDEFSQIINKSIDSLGEYLVLKSEDQKKSKEKLIYEGVKDGSNKLHELMFRYISTKYKDYTLPNEEEHRTNYKLLIYDEERNKEDIRPDTIGRDHIFGYVSFCLEKLSLTLQKLERNPAPPVSIHNPSTRPRRGPDL